MPFGRSLFCRAGKFGYFVRGKVCAVCAKRHQNTDCGYDQKEQDEPENSSHIALLIFFDVDYVPRGIFEEEGPGRDGLGV